LPTSLRALWLDGQLLGGWFDMTTYFGMFSRGPRYLTVKG
jgi:hypothetical protein